MISEIQEKKPRSVEEVSEIVANMVKHSAQLDNESTELYRRAVEQIITFTGNWSKPSQGGFDQSNTIVL